MTPKEQLVEIEKCSKSFSYWVEHYLKDEKGNPIVLTKVQKSVMRSLDEIGAGENNTVIPKYWRPSIPVARQIWEFWKYYKEKE